MQTKYAGRFTLISVVLLVGLVGIFPLGRLFDSKVPWDKKIGLKAGIDISGGTRLEYRVKLPPEEAAGVLDDVLTVLKKRVDPFGVRNLMWRALPPDRIEVRMPMGASSKEAQEAAQKFNLAKKNLDATNLRWSTVENALSLPVAERAAKLSKLAEGSETRKDVLDKLPGVYDEIQNLRRLEREASVRQTSAPPATTAATTTTAPAAASQPTASSAYTFGMKRAELEEKQLNPLKEKLEQTNIDTAGLEVMLDTAAQKIEKATKDSRAADAAAARAEADAAANKLRDRNADFPARVSALDRFLATHKQYAEYRASLTDVEELKQLLTGSGVLEFHILVRDMSTDKAQQMVKRMQPGNPVGPVAQPGDEMKWFEVDRPNELGAQTFKWSDDKSYALAWVTPEASMVHRKEGQGDWALKRAYPTNNNAGQAVVGFEFDTVGAGMFGELTGTHINQPLATVLDGRIVTAPNINSRIEGVGVIEGGRNGYKKAELNYLVNTLNAGALKASLEGKPIGERTIQPELGAANLSKGLLSCAIGLVIVVIFLVGYYHLSGVVASVAVLMNMVIIVGVLGFFNATFTLPGIAALVLTLGAAVDANVLIFERLREEQHRGMSLRMALRNAYDRALSAILDSNAITIITSVILYWIGSEDVKGFGLTLLIGILSSLFTALFVTRTIFNWMIDRWDLKRLGSLPLSWPKLDKALKPNWDWMGMAWIFYAFSGVFIVAGLIAFFAQGRDMFDIEFVSGTTVELALKHPMDREAVEARLAEFPDKLPGARANALGAGGTEYEVVTLNSKANEVRAAIVQALGENLDVRMPSQFHNVGAEYPAVSAGPKEERCVFPVVENKNTRTAEFEGIESVLGYQPRVDGGTEFADNGVAILLRHMAPALSADEISERLDAVRQQLPGGGAVRRLIYVLPRETDSALVLISKSNASYNRGRNLWEQDLAKPAWDMVRGTINKQAELRRVDSADPLVARDTMLAAIIALAVSCVLIMVYLWLRFGNFKYGSATVVAMLHDVLIIVGALGLSHYIGKTVIGSALLVEPFRINLIMVAALLTVMSYSMIDTIVIFDRIRENRGKMGMVSRQVINDSINQTLSRTLLTAGTTIFTVFAMYVIGGSGIHGFTFALLIGILVGTYSSIAIASPLLLLGKEKVAANRRASMGARAV